MYVIRNKKLPKGAYVKLIYGGVEHEGICRGSEQGVNNGYRGYNILQYIDGDVGHGATNEDGEKFEHCWWIERTSKIIECTSLHPSANISELF